MALFLRKYSYEYYIANRRLFKLTSKIYTLNSQTVIYNNQKMSRKILHTEILPHSICGFQKCSPLLVQ